MSARQGGDSVCVPGRGRCLRASCNVSGTCDSWRLSDCNVSCEGILLLAFPQTPCLFSVISVKGNDICR